MTFYDYEKYKEDEGAGHQGDDSAMIQLNADSVQQQQPIQVIVASHRPQEHCQTGVYILPVPNQQHQSFPQDVCQYESTLIPKVQQTVQQQDGEQE